MLKIIIGLFVLVLMYCALRSRSKNSIDNFKSLGLVAGTIIVAVLSALLYIL